LRLAVAIGGIVALTLGCSVLAQRSAEKPLGTHYSAAFLTGGDLVVFPFNGKKITASLPPAFAGYSFSADGKSIYGFAGSTGAPPVSVASIKRLGLTAIKASQGLEDIESVAPDADGGIVAVSALRRRDGARECGVFVLDVARETAEHVVDNPGGDCFGFVSLWKGLSLSPDGSRAVGTAGSRSLGVINLERHRIEKLWPGSAASWSPDGKWIADLTYALPAEIHLIRASDLSTERTLGQTRGGRLQWSPDSRYLLLLDMGACGVGTGYFGTLETLDIDTGQRAVIASSRCKVNHPSFGWISDDVLK
jgi:Tol biopolymer transport system component